MITFLIILLFIILLLSGVTAISEGPKSSLPASFVYIATLAGLISTIYFLK